jgi:hypothetical protein
LKRFFATLLAAVFVVGFATDGVARKGSAHRAGGRFVRDPTVLLGSAPPQAPALGNRIPAPLAPPAQAPVINGPISQPSFRGLTGIGQ